MKLDKSSAYSQKLKDPRWQKIRLEVFERDEWTCCRCGDKDTTLSVHHRRYVPGREPWDYPIHELTTLCEICHKDDYELGYNAEKRLLSAVRLAGFYSSDIEEIANGFEKISLQHIPEVVASAMRYALENKDTQKFLIEKYFEYLATKRENHDNTNQG
jgi:ribosomal protein S27AE